MRLLVSLALVAAAAGPESPAALRARARAAYGQGGGLKAFELDPANKDAKWLSSRSGTASGSCTPSIPP
jgi:hypothetical protein